MDRIYLARHPVPFVGIPRRASLQSVLYDRGATPVRIREVAAGAARFLTTKTEHGRTNDSTLDFSVYGMDDGLWTPFPSLNGRNSREAFVHFLESEEAPQITRGALPALDLVDAILARTPLRSCRRMGMVSLSGGKVLAPSDVRSTIARDDARIVANLNRFLDERVVLSGDMAFIRSPGPIATHVDGELYRLRIMAVARHIDSGAIGAPDMIERHWNWHCTRPLSSQADRKRFSTRNPVILDGLPAVIPAVESDDAWLAANEVTDEFLSRAWTLSPAVRAQFPDRLDGLELDAMWASVGELRGDEAIFALERVASLAGEIANLHPRSKIADLGMRVASVDLPRAREYWQAHPSLDADDEAALTAMAY